MKKLLVIMLALMLALSLAACSSLEEPAPQTPEAAPPPESAEAPEQAQAPSGAAPLKGVYAAEENCLYLADTDFAQEFGEMNQGIAQYDPETDTLTLGITKNTGTHYGVLNGPMLHFTVDLTNGTVISREYTPEPDDESFHRERDDDGSLENVSDERLVEIARTLREQIGVAPDGGYK